MPTSQEPQVKSDPPNIQEILDRHTKVFGKILHGIPPNGGIEHVIELEEGAKPIMITPYHHPKKHKDEIKRKLRSCWK